MMKVVHQCFSLMISRKSEYYITIASAASGLHAVIFYRYISYAAVAMDSHEPPHERDDDDEGPEDHLGRCETVDVTSSVFPGAAGALEESPPPPQCNLFGLLNYIENLGVYHESQPLSP